MSSNAANGSEIVRALATIAGALSGQQPGISSSDPTNHESTGTPSNLPPAAASTSNTPTYRYSNCTSGI